MSETDYYELEHLAWKRYQAYKAAWYAACGDSAWSRGKYPSAAIHNWKMAGRAYAHAIDGEIR